MTFRGKGGLLWAEGKAGVEGSAWKAISCVGLRESLWAARSAVCVGGEQEHQQWARHVAQVVACSPNMHEALFDGGATHVPEVR